MPTLSRLLIDYEPDLLQIIAEMWDVDIASEHHIEMAEELAEVISRQDKVDKMWERLGEDERSALMELQSSGGQILEATFARQYGELRPMGKARRERERPWMNPESTTEVLYYRGLVAQIFTRAPGGAQAAIVIPDEFREKLPQSGRSGYAPGHPVAPPRQIKAGLSSAVDDIATLITLLIMQPTDASEWLTTEPIPHIDQYLRRSSPPAYRALLSLLAYETGLIEDSDGSTEVDRESSRPWLEAPRLHQMRVLAETWAQSSVWNDLAYTPGLEADTWPNKPLFTRRAFLNLLAQVPAATWWSIDSFIEHVKQHAPDFQRPGGDFSAWYLRDSFTGDLIPGFEHWDLVEGAMIRFVLEGPMQWLGLVQAGAGAFTLTDLGSALVGQAGWPSHPDIDSEIKVDPVGNIYVPIHVSRYERLQIARFSAWVRTPPPGTIQAGTYSKDDGAYVYQLTSESLEGAESEGISAANIISFLKRLHGNDLPPNLISMFEGWQTVPDKVKLQNVVILTAKDIGVYERLRSNPQVTKLLGRKAGPYGHVVRIQDLPTIEKLLRQMGILPLFEGSDDSDLF